MKEVEGVLYIMLFLIITILVERFRVLCWNTILDNVLVLLICMLCGSCVYVI